jgi:hypothetical protein
MKKYFLLILILLTVAVFLANAFYGNKIAKGIDTQLKNKIEDNELPVVISYSEVKVNPLFSKLSFTDVRVEDPKQESEFKCKELKADIPYNEALRLAESDSFEEIRSMKLTFVKPELISESNILLAANDISIDFDGHLTREDFENISTQFPNKEQELEFSFTKLMVNIPQTPSTPSPISELQKQLGQIDKGSYTVVFSPETSTLKVKEFSLESSVLSYSGQHQIKYKGDGVEEFRPETTKMKADLLFEPKDIRWEDKNGNREKVSLKKLHFVTNSEMGFEKGKWPEGEMKLVVEKLKVKSEGENNAKRGGFFQLPVDDIDVDKLKVNYELQNGALKITDTNIKSSAIDADIFANINVNTTNPAMSTINEGKIKVSHLSEELEELLNGFEQQMGKKLPRKNNSIVLEMSGLLMKPSIKDFEY